MTDYRITDQMLRQWRSTCFKAGCNDPNNDHCHSCQFEPKTGPRKGCCNFDDNEMEKIFRSIPLGQTKQTVGIHCPICGWHQTVPEEEWNFQHLQGHGHTCGSGKCPSHTYMILD